MQDLGEKKSMVLRNHGLLTAGNTVAEAFVLMYYLEQSCRMQIDVMSSGGTIETETLVSVLMNGGLPPESASHH